MAFHILGLREQRANRHHLERARCRGSSGLTEAFAERVSLGVWTEIEMLPDSIKRRARVRRGTVSGSANVKVDLAFLANLPHIQPETALQQSAVKFHPESAQ